MLELKGNTSILADLAAHKFDVSSILLKLRSLWHCIGT